MPVLSVVSIVLGAMALSQINQNPSQSGRAMATAGIVLGCISLVMAVVFWVIYMVSPDAAQFHGGFPFR